MKYFLFIAIILVCFSCTSDFYTAADFGKVGKIDTHMHLNAKHLALAEQAQEDNFKLLTVNVDVSSYPSLEDQEQYAIHQIKHFPDRVSFLTAFTLTQWDSANWSDITIEQLKKSFDKGAYGIKLWKNIGMVYKDAAGKFIMIDDPKFDSVIQYIIDQDKTVMAHLGEPKNCWLPLEQMTVNNDRSYFKAHPEYHMYLHPEYPSYEDQINARDRFVEKHPDMRFVGAHLGSLEWSVDELAKRLDKFPNMAVDMAARIPHLQHQSKLDREKVRQFLIRYQDRIIYATDSGISADANIENEKKDLHNTWINDWKYFVTDETLTSPHVNGDFQGLQLPRTVTDKIYRENAMKWFKIK
ncbi:amidohydrolase family protein [Chryseolinea sp. H1M3-3]|uniref:amidohydrolase family protein n=1 Tax=Chryseolinea sp. H1M3-3 TaxID=3034144 RepID=UPI0023EE1745|nr:amidohydrolase family protein [Chryseolinea sp. H1M3-3]